MSDLGSKAVLTAPKTDFRSSPNNITGQSRHFRKVPTSDPCLNFAAYSLGRPASRISSTGQSGTAPSEHRATVSARMASSLARSESLLRTFVRCAIAILCTSAHEARSGPPRANKARISSRVNPRSRGAPDEGQCSSFGRSVEPPTVRRSARRRQHFDALVVADGLNVHAAVLGKLTDRDAFGSRGSDGAHEIVLDPVVATGCMV